MPQRLGDMQIGEKVRMGTIYGNPIVWQVADKNFAGYPSDSVTLISEKILKFAAYDAIEPTNSDAQRQAYGNNRFMHSNILQWLNATAQSDWYKAQHSADRPPTGAYAGYNSYWMFPGFLSGFNEMEHDAILDTTLTVARHEIDGGGYDVFTRKVFLPNSMEALFSANTNESRIARLTTDAANNNTIPPPAYGNPRPGDPWHWWLRQGTTAGVHTASIIRVNRDGRQETANACADNVGVRPSFNLSAKVFASDELDENGARTLIYSEPPIQPSFLTVPGVALVNRPFKLTWGASTDPDGDPVSYRLERRVDGGAWSSVYVGADLQFADLVLEGWGTVQYRVSAFDTHLLYSAYVTGETRTVLYNYPAEISIGDGELGVFASSFDPIEYVVTDDDGDDVEVTELLDGQVLRVYSAVLGEVNTLALDGEAWFRVPNGAHTLQIIADDKKSLPTICTLTFTRSETRILFTMAEPIRADARPTLCVVNIQGSFPAGSRLKIEICNNALDPAPAWEEITTNVLYGEKYAFVNEAKTAETWGVLVRASLERNLAVGPCNIQSLGGSFV